jgi:hypothetical protein
LRQTGTRERKSLFVATPLLLFLALALVPGFLGRARVRTRRRVEEIRRVDNSFGSRESPGRSSWTGNWAD